MLLIKKKKTNILLHNYYPPKKKSFVINLASSNKQIQKKSFNMIKQAIYYTNKIGSKFYSFHAGFLLDPSPKLLGKKFGKIRLYDKNLSIKIFVKNIKILSKYAKKKNVILLIENNVITKKNLEIFKKNPLLMCDYNETIKIFKKLPSNVKLLLDVGHLKVSAKTLGFNKIDFIKKLKKKIFAAHLSENDSINDLNLPVQNNSWFWPYIKNLNYYTLEIKNEDIKILKKSIALTIKKIR